MYALDINESFSFKRIKFELTDSSVEQYKILCHQPFKEAISSLAISLSDCKAST
jgi:hypothetical protein